jgi:hypothetical protein
MNRNPISLRAHVCLIGLLLVSGSAYGAVLSLNGANVGTIATEGPSATSTAASGGVNFWAHWQLDSGQGVVNAGDLRWLQLASFSKAVPGFPNPNRPFIDPRSGTLLGGVTADDEPWYDITGATKATLSLTGGGDDPWMGDGPYASWTLGPLTFTADTLVVVVTDWTAKQARVLGGVHWGYSITDATLKQVTPIAVIELTDSKALRDAFNTALALDFNGWTLVVPEPASTVLIISGVVVLAGYAGFRRSRRAA